MGSYSYKEVCYRPGIQACVETFEKDHGREFDEDPNYNGDYWIVVSDYIDKLESERNELVKAAKELIMHLYDPPTGQPSHVYVAALRNLLGEETL